MLIWCVRQVNVLQEYKTDLDFAAMVDSLLLNYTDKYACWPSLRPRANTLIYCCVCVVCVVCVAVTSTTSCNAW